MATRWQSFRKRWASRRSKSAGARPEGVATRTVAPPPARTRLWKNMRRPR